MSFVEHFLLWSHKGKLNQRRERPNEKNLSDQFRKKFGRFTRDKHSIYIQVQRWPSNGL